MYQTTAGYRLTLGASPAGTFDTAETKESRQRRTRSQRALSRRQQAKLRRNQHILTSVELLDTNDEVDG